MNQLTASTSHLKSTRSTVRTWVMGSVLTVVLSVTTSWANADGGYSDSYDYGGEAIHLFVAVDQRGPETLDLRRLLSREHRVDTNDYILLAVVVDNLNASDAGFARLSVGRHKGPNVQTADFQTRLLAPADERRGWKLYLSRDAKITGFTAILAPRAYSNYRGGDYGYYDRAYLNNSTFYGWIWRDRYYQHPRGHRYYDSRHSDRYFGRQYDPRSDRRYNRSRDLHYRSHRDNRGQRNDRNAHKDNRPAPDQNANQRHRPARPGFGDRDLYEHERAQLPQRRARPPSSHNNRNNNRSNSNRDQRLRGNHEHRAEHRNNRERINPTRSNPARQTARAATPRPRAERPRAQTRPQPRQQTRPQANSARAQKRPQLNKQRVLPRRDQTQPRAER